LVRRSLFHKLGTFSLGSSTREHKSMEGREEMRSIMARLTRAAVLLLIMGVAITATSADNGSTKNSDGSTPSGQTLALEDWTKIPSGPNLRIVWYKLGKDAKTGKPLKLYSLTCDDEKNLPQEIKDAPEIKDVIQKAFKACCDKGAKGTATPSLPKEEHPLLSGEQLVIAIFDPDNLLVTNNISSINLLVASAPATLPTPAGRPILSGSTEETKALPKNPVYFLDSRKPLAGHTYVTPTITLFPEPANLPKPVPPPGDDKCPCANAIVTAIAQAVAPAAKTDQTKQIPLAVPETYPAVHQLYAYNINSGIIYSTLRNPTWSRVETAAAAGCTSGSASSCASPELYATVQNAAPRPIMPALFFTPYLFGSSDAPRKWGVFGQVDGDRKWHVSDAAPQPSFGFSLTSPSTDFFAGGNSEVLCRYVQVVYGVHRGKVNYLVPTLTNDPTSSVAPLTATRFGTGFFFGITLNINYIKAAFGK
jgi:hypothetical protein